MPAYLFIVNGHMGVISASLVAKMLNPTGINVLISERNILTQKGRMRIDYSVYDKITDLLEFWVPWTERNLFHLEVRHPTITTPVQYINYVAYIKSLKPEVEKLSGGIKNYDCIFYSGNCKLRSAVWTNVVPFALIEHGASDYCHLMDKETLFLEFKKIVSNIFGFHYLERPTKAVLMDRGNSGAQKVAHRSIEIVSLDCRKYISQLCAFFECEYSSRFPSEHAEITKIRNMAGKYDRSYLYLPTDSDLVKETMVPDYISRQINKVDTSRKLFIIKNHPRNQYNYANIMKSLGAHSLNFNMILNRYIPAEFLAQMLGGIQMFSGTFSTSLLYADWWFEQVPLLVEVNEEPYASLYKLEYPHLYKYRHLWDRYLVNG